MKPLVVSFYTGDPIYEEGAEKLRASAEKWGYEHLIGPWTDKGSWVKNCARKAGYILSTLVKTNYETPVVWVDCDSEILKTLEHLHDAEVDFAVPWSSGSRDTGFGTGVVYFAPTVGGIRMLKRWKKDCLPIIKGESQEWDQVTLHKSWKGLGAERPITQFLPQGYVKVFNHGWRAGEPQVEYVRHQQFSRQVRKQENESK
jgi:hypothetical protein